MVFHGLGTRYGRSPITPHQVPVGPTSLVPTRSTEADPELFSHDPRTGLSCWFAPGHRSRRPQLRPRLPWCSARPCRAGTPGPPAGIATNSLACGSSDDRGTDRPTSGAGGGAYRRTLLPCQRRRPGGSPPERELWPLGALHSGRRRPAIRLAVPAVGLGRAAEAACRRPAVHRRGGSVPRPEYICAGPVTQTWLYWRPHSQPSGWGVTVVVDGDARHEAERDRVLALLDRLAPRR